MSGSDYDVAVVGASTAGCTAARLFAQRGARVALIERRPKLDAYKTVCTHYIQPSATPVIEKLGLAALLEQRGAVHNKVALWTRHGGWIDAGHDAPYGYSITRKTLDPMLRSLAAETPGVELLAGLTATGLTGGARPDGVDVEDSSHERRRIGARLVVAADGRDTKLARWTNVPGRVKPHGRFFYWAYWRGIPSQDTMSRTWLLEPDAAYTFPNEDDLTVVLVAPHRDRLPEFKADLEGAYMAMVESLPDGPDLARATRESKILGKLDLPNVMRPAAKPGIAFIGDAALASDPLFGVGCGWAFQSADWLVEETADALVSGRGLDAALDRYRKVHRRRLLAHHMMIADLSSGRPLNAFERRLFRVAARDRVAREAFEAVGARRHQPWSVFAPRVLARLVAGIG